MGGACDGRSSVAVYGDEKWGMGQVEGAIQGQWIGNNGGVGGGRVIAGGYGEES